LTLSGDGTRAALTTGMRLHANALVLPLAALVAALALGCASSSSSGGDLVGTTDPTTASTDAQRSIAEADIIQIRSGRLYALSRSGTVSVVDVSTPGTLTLLGQTTLPGEPFEMYLRGDSLVVMSNGAVTTNGTVSTYYQAPSQGYGALVTVVDVSNPALMTTVASLKVPGEIADSRTVGQVLYLVTYENATCYSCGPVPRTMVTTFDITTPTAIRQVEQVSFEYNTSDPSSQMWGGNWKRSIFVTDQRMYVGGHADAAPRNFSNTSSEGIIDVLDVSDPTGRLGTGTRLTVAGAVLSRWQMDERNGVLRVISQRGAGRSTNGLAPPAVETFRVYGADSFVALGHTTLTLSQAEGLRTVRFDDTRAYAITYGQVDRTPRDPLFIIDLSDPLNPKQRGTLSMPGFMYYLEPYGDRVIGLGVDNSDPGGSLNVSLFDVSDAGAPKMLARVPFALAGITSDYPILNSEVSEDQDRIQKSFKVFPDGLVAIPFATPRAYSTSGSCANEGGGIQLVDWQGDTLTKQALLPLPGNPRRAFENNDELIGVSDSNVRAFSLADLRVAHETADLVIGDCIPLPPITRTGSFGGDGAPLACSAAPAAPAPGGWAAVVLLAALALTCRTARARRQGGSGPTSGGPRA
jgi:hypothetical protein